MRSDELPSLKKQERLPRVRLTTNDIYPAREIWLVRLGPGLGSLSRAAHPIRRQIVLSWSSPKWVGRRSQRLKTIEVATSCSSSPQAHLDKCKAYLWRRLVERFRQFSNHNKKMDHNFQSRAVRKEPAASTAPHIAGPNRQRFRVGALPPQCECAALLIVTSACGSGECTRRLQKST